MFGFWSNIGSNSWFIIELKTNLIKLWNTLLNILNKNTIVIGGKTTTLNVWWTDYATWLEKKLEEEKRYIKITGPNK